MTNFKSFGSHLDVPPLTRPKKSGIFTLRESDFTYKYLMIFPHSKWSTNAIKFGMHSPFDPKIEPCYQLPVTYLLDSCNDPPPQHLSNKN